jgi:hypothetical protein
MDSTDFTKYVDYWDLYEDKNGLTTSIVAELSEYIRSPILVIGSGQGLIPGYLISIGEKVISVDINQKMADKALERRGIQTVVADAATVKLQQQFNTIIVSTGIASIERIEGKFLDKFLENIKTHSNRNAQIIFCYFWNSPWEQARKLLGIVKSPSNEVYFWKAQGHLETAKRLLISEGGIPQETVDKLFHQHKEVLQALLKSILLIGERYRSINNGQDPKPYFSSMELRKNGIITDQYELVLKRKLQLSNFQLDQILTFKEIRVLLCTAKSLTDFI